MNQNETNRDVLIIDDDAIFQEIAASFLVQRGAKRILHAMDGKQAADELGNSSNQIGFMLCDINMPDSDGIEFLDFLRETGCQIPFAIASSAEKHIIRSAEKLASAYSLNLVGTFGKPLDFERMNDLAELYLA